jgi:hypothetical protein
MADAKNTEENGINYCTFKVYTVFRTKEKGLGLVYF